MCPQSPGISHTLPHTMNFSRIGINYHEPSITYKSLPIKFINIMWLHVKVVII